MIFIWSMECIDGDKPGIFTNDELAQSSFSLQYCISASTMGKEQGRIVTYHRERKIFDYQ